MVDSFKLNMPLRISTKMPLLSESDAKKVCKLSNEENQLLRDKIMSLDSKEMPDMCPLKNLSN